MFGWPSQRRRTQIVEDVNLVDKVVTLVLFKVSDVNNLDSFVPRARVDLFGFEDDASHASA